MLVKFCRRKICDNLRIIHDNSRSAKALGKIQNKNLTENAQQYVAFNDDFFKGSGFALEPTTNRE